MKLHLQIKKYLIKYFQRFINGILREHKNEPELLEMITNILFDYNIRDISFFLFN